MKKKIFLVNMKMTTHNGLDESCPNFFELTDHLNSMNHVTPIDRNIKFDLIADNLCSASPSQTNADLDSNIK